MSNNNNTSAAAAQTAATSTTSIQSNSSSTAPINEPITLISGTSTQIPSHLSQPSFRISLTSFSLGILFGSTLFLSISLFSPVSFKLALQNGWNSQIWSSSWWSSQGGGGGEGLEITKGLASILPKIAFASSNQIGNHHHHWIWNPFLKPQFNFYLLSWSCFHMLEFLITARYNPTRLHVDSFLLQNGLAYHLAHLLGITEFILETYFFPSLKNLNYLTYVGVLILLAGQFVRSLAMIHASGNFSHTVAWKKRGDHQLVTDGIYSLTRHPSYLGFFYWALSTQILLFNPLSFLIFLVVLWRFFNHRIRVEEEYLVEFFGKDYETYRKKVGTLLPLIK